MECFSRITDEFKQYYLKNPLRCTYILIFFSFLFLFAICTICSKGEVLSNALFSDKRDTFMDYFNSIMYSCDDPYQKYHIIYPPLITVFYSIIGFYTIPYKINSIGDDIAFQLRNSQLGLLLFLFITIVSLAVLYKTTKKNIEQKNNLDKLIPLSLIISFPLIYAVERGNSIIYVLTLVSIFLLGYNSQNRLIRYISYASLAIAVGIKIYVILFILLILREKRITEFAVCYSVVILFFFIPFLFTDGTAYDLIHYIFANSDVSEINDSGSFNNISSIVGFFSGLLGKSMTHALQYVLLAILYISTIIATIRTNLKHWKIITALCCAITLGLGSGATYNTCLFILPLTLLLKEEKSLNLSNLTYLVLFSLLLIWIPTISSSITEIEYVHTAPVIIIELLLLYDVLHNLGKHESLKINQETTPKCALFTLSIISIIVLASIIVPLFSSPEEKTIDNIGHNNMEMVNPDDSYYFYYDSQNSVFEVNDIENNWNEHTGEYLIVCEKGYVAPSSVMWITEKGNRVGEDLNGDWHGYIKEKTIHLEYTDSNGKQDSITWTYSDYAIISQKDGDLTYFSSAVSNDRAYLSNEDIVYSTMFSNDNQVIFGIEGEKLFVNGIEEGEIGYKFIQSNSYIGVKYIRTTYSNTSIIYDEGQEDHLIGFIVPKEVHCTIGVQDKERTVQLLIGAGLSVIWLCGATLLIYRQHK